jgi:hypothetical protein
MDWAPSAEDQWWAVVNTAVILLVAESARNFMPSSERT